MRNMVWDQPPQPVEPTTMRQAPILYNADTGQKVGGRLQRWASGFSLPGQGAVKVRFGRVPDSPTHTGSEPAGVVYDEKLRENVMYFDPTWYTRKNFHRKELRTAGREAMYDELTHLYDRSGKLPESTKQRFLQIMGEQRAWRPPQDQWGDGPPNEQFSEASLGYLMGYKRATPRWTGGYGFNPTQQQWNQIRKLFAGLK